MDVSHAFPMLSVFVSQQRVRSAHPFEPDGASAAIKFRHHKTEGTELQTLPRLEKQRDKRTKPDPPDRADYPQIQLTGYFVSGRLSSVHHLAGSESDSGPDV